MGAFVEFEFRSLSKTVIRIAECCLNAQRDYICRLVLDCGVINRNKYASDWRPFPFSSSIIYYVALSPRLWSPYLSDICCGVRKSRSRRCFLVSALNALATRSVILIAIPRQKTEGVASWRIGIGFWTCDGSLWNSYNWIYPLVVNFCVWILIMTEHRVVII